MQEEYDELWPGFELSYGWPTRPRMIQAERWDQVPPGVEQLYFCGKDFAPLVLLPNLRELRAYLTNQRQIDDLCQLKELRYLYTNWSPRLGSPDWLAGFEQLRLLDLGGKFRDFSLEPLSELANLRALTLTAPIGTTINGGTGRVKTFAPIAKLHNLRHLALYGITPEAGGAAPLAQLTGLKELEISNRFPVSELALLSVALPETDGFFHAAFSEIGPTQYLECKNCQGKELIRLHGAKRGWMKCPECDKAKIETHRLEYEHWKSHYLTSSGIKSAFSGA